MTDKKYLQDNTGNVYWPMTAIDAVVGLNFINSSDANASYQRIGNLVFVEFNNVDSNYTLPTDYRPLTKQSFTINASNTLTIDNNGVITTTTNDKVSGRFWYFIN